MSSLHFEVVGHGTDLVLLHGWGLNLRVWDGLVQELREEFRLITIDLPGHGRSPWSAGRSTPAEQAWLIHQSLAPISARYALLGWSIGAQIALDLAAATPAQIASLILVAATPKFAAGPDWLHGATPESIAKLATQLQQDYRQTLSDFLDLQVRGSASGEAALAQLRRSLFEQGEASQEALANGLDRLANSDLRATLAHVRAPTLVIAGQYDRITPPAASQAVAAAIPGARYVEMPRAAHAPFLSHLKEFAQLIRAFVRTPAAERKSTGRSKPLKRKKLHWSRRK